MQVCECGDYTFGITYTGLRPKNRPNYDGRGGRGRGWVSLSLSGVASGGVGSPRGTPPRAPVSVYAARTHAHGCTRDGPATRRRRRSTATAGDGRRWRATVGDGIDGAGSGVSRRSAAPCRGRASGLRPCPAAIARRCTSRARAADRRQGAEPARMVDGRTRNGPDENGISGSRRRHSVDSHGRSSNYPSLLKPFAAASAVRHPHGIPSA